MQWPRNGTLNHDIITPMMHYLQDNGKWEEIPYLDLFYYLGRRTDWQKECGIMVLTVANEKCRGCENRDQKADYLVKYKDPEEDVSLLVSPSAPPPETASEEEGEEGGETREKGDGKSKRHTPISKRTRGHLVSKKGGREGGTHVMAPLREAVGPQGDQVMVKVPFSPNDLIIWKQSAGSYREDPDRTARVVKMVIKTQNPDWNDLQVLLDTLMDSTEKEMVLRAMTEKAREMIRLRVADGTLNELVPREDREWDPNTARGHQALKGYQELLIEGVRTGIPKTVNWSKLYSVKQEKNESPSAFLERLKETVRRYTSLEVEGEAGRLQLALIFMGQSQEDIRKKLQKLEGEDTRNLEKLLEVAWKVYNNREKESVRKQQASMLAVLQQAVGRGNGRGRARGRGGFGRGRGGGQVRLGYDQCALCKNKGHWKNECPLNSGIGIPRQFGNSSAEVAQALVMGEYQNQS
ncbi:hypothetical protein DUI87_29859 [Hirundo rustica rustica]|uniref:Core shell protein Gag P30 domain-containing protein n=1 Tax=Hirundo rustica rustica TaxID=333673 RepID=A0A3M0J402_HIRRU|nr:hypothetical protein DUI87_29859 [Hirundo rustica rustica]